MDLLIHRDYRTATYDMIFENGACPTTNGVPDAVVQRLYIRLKTLYQEWFLNVEYGVPYFEKILAQRNRRETVDMILQEHILAERGVKEIVSFESSFDNPSRVYSCSFTVRAEDGSITPSIEI